MLAISGRPTGICAAVVLNAMEHTSEDYYKGALLTVFPMIYKDVPKEKADRMVAEAQNLLESPDITNRMHASQSLAKWVPWLPSIDSSGLQVADLF